MSQVEELELKLANAKLEEKLGEKVHDARQTALRSVSRWKTEYEQQNVKIVDFLEKLEKFSSKYKLSSRTLTKSEKPYYYIQDEKVELEPITTTQNMYSIIYEGSTKFEFTYQDGGLDLPGRLTNRMQSYKSMKVVHDKVTDYFVEKNREAKADEKRETANADAIDYLNELYPKDKVTYSKDYRSSGRGRNYVGYNNHYVTVTFKNGISIKYEIVLPWGDMTETFILRRTAITFPKSVSDFDDFSHIARVLKQIKIQ